MFSSIVVALAASCIYAHAVPLKNAPKPNKITLSRRQVSAKSQLLDELTSFEGKNPLDKRNSAPVFPLTQGLPDGIVQQYWSGPIQVGTPPQTLIVAIDTTNPDLVFSGPNCDSSCRSYLFYNPNSSSTAVVGSNYNASTLNYYPGAFAYGTAVTDTVEIAGISVPEYTFGVASQYVGSPEYNTTETYVDGIIGFGFKNSSIWGSSSLFQSIAAQLNVPAVFALKLARSGVSELLIGQVDDTLYSGEFTELPVVENPEGAWVVVIDAISGNNSSVILNAHAIIETTSSIITGPTQDVAKFYSSIGGSYVGDYGGYMSVYDYPCNSSSNPDVSLTFGGQNFSIPPSLFASGPPSNNGRCVGNILGLDAAYWNIGSDFLQSVYSKFDYDNNTLAFAALA